MTGTVLTNTVMILGMAAVTVFVKDRKSVV